VRLPLKVLGLKRKKKRGGVETKKDNETKKKNEAGMAIVGIANAKKTELTQRS